MKIEMEVMDQRNLKNDRNETSDRNEMMIVNPYSMSLAARDQMLMRIEDEIEKKRQMLADKRKHLKKVMNQNDFLKEVMGDYTNYYGVIMEQKQEQMHALEMLNKYIDDLIKSEKLTSENIKDARKEQKKILYEVKKIKGSLDSLL